MSATPERVEKLMALTLADFHRSLTVLAPDLAPGSDQSRVAMAVDGGRVEIVFQAQERATLGGLLTLPRALVVLTFEHMDAEAQRAFLARFDQAFQRGGG